MEQVKSIDWLRSYNKTLGKVLPSRHQAKFSDVVTYFLLITHAYWRTVNQIIDVQKRKNLSTLIFCPTDGRTFLKIKFLEQKLSMLRVNKYSLHCDINKLNVVNGSSVICLLPAQTASSPGRYRHLLGKIFLCNIRHLCLHSKGLTLMAITDIQKRKNCHQTPFLSI